MKKYLSIVLATAFLLSSAFAETVYVTICDDQGNLAVAHEAVTAADLNGDNVINMNEVLIAAHDQAYPGGSAAGYEALDLGYGLSLNRLWGVENGGSYGYYINNTSAYSLLDPVSDGDALCAYAFTDLEAWSDTYSFFDTAVVETDSAFELTLSAQSFDAEWNPVILPVEGAVITVNGEDSAIITNADGKATIELSAGEYILSAHSESMTLVPPVCRASISEVE